MRKLAALSALTLFGLTGFAAAAEEVTLRGVTSFAEKTTFSRGFERFIDRVNDTGKGVIHINYIGGPKAMPPFEVGNALKNGVIDVANVTGAFYVNLMPEADAWKLRQVSMAELRRNGGVDYFGGIYAQKLNSVYLANLAGENPFHLYLNKKISSPDLTGLKLRITPVYRDFFQALGGTVVQTAPGEVYTALERGVVDGYGWPITGIFDLGWQEKTKYRVDPGFYNSEVSVLINKSTWDKLTTEQKAVLQKAGAEGEADAIPEFNKLDAEETERQGKAGIEPITFDAAGTKHYLDVAYEAGWAGVARQSPEATPKLRGFLSKPQ
jgi:TRAP-type transport system periplasmic protein